MHAADFEPIRPCLDASTMATIRGRARITVEMECPRCRADNPADKRFCGDCGARLESTQPPDRAPSASDADLAAGRSTEERRLVTALFADLSGFTALARQVDAEDLHDIVDPVVGRLSSIAGRNGAYVEKFAGDALLAIFGAPTAHEDDAERALETALEMHREIARAHEVFPAGAVDLSLHVGIDSGHGIARVIGSEARTDYGVIGDVVILAQRLESAAPAGATYVGATTVELARRRFRFELVGPVALKGIDEPMPVWRLVGPMSEVAVGSSPRAAGMVGRDDELTTLGTAVADMVSGIGTVAVINGEAGVGKTTLLDALRRRHLDGAAQMSVGRCLSHGAASAYHPWADLVRDIAGIDVDDPPDSAGTTLDALLAAHDLGGALPYLARLLDVPTTATRTADPATAADLEPEAFRRALEIAMVRLLAAHAAARPLALVIEDIQWLDAASLELLRVVAGQAASIPLLLCLTTRPEGAVIADGVAARAVAGGARRVDLLLGPLPEAVVADLVARLLGGTPTPELVHGLAVRSDGNAYFVTESVRALREAGSLAIGSDGCWGLVDGGSIDVVPGTLEGIIGARVDRSSAGAARLLEQASILGLRVDPVLLQAMGGPHERLDALVDELTAAGLLDRVGDPPVVLTFHHALVRDVAYGRLLRSQRRTLHRRAADAIEAAYGVGDDVIDVLALHLYLAAAGSRAVDALVRSAGRARAVFANEEAILGYERAAEIARSAPEAAARLPGVLLALGEVRDLLGDYEAAVALFEEVRASNDIRAWRGLAAVKRRQGAYGAALELLDEVALALPPGADPRAIDLERASTLLFAGRFAEAVVAAEAGLGRGGIAATDLAREVAGADEPAGSEAAQAQREALESTADELTGRLILQVAAAEHQQRVPGSQEASLRHALTAEAILRRHGDVRSLVVALRTIGSVHWQAGRAREAAAALGEALELAERTGGVEEIGGTLIDLALARLALGEATAAVELDRRAIAEFERVGHASGLMIATANLAEALVATGELDEAVGVAHEALRLADELDDRTTCADVTLTLARERVRRGDLHGAVDGAEDAARRFLELGEPSTAKEALALAADAARLAGDDERTRALEAQIRSLGDARAGSAAGDAGGEPG